MNFLQEIIWNVFNQRMILVIGAVAGLPLTLILIVCFARKKNRDERGWKIIGKASVITFAYFMVMANVIAKIVGSSAYEITYFFYANTIQWLYNTMAIIEIVSIQILKRIE